MKNQLTLLSSEDSMWRIDEETREVGRKGIPAARAALQASRRAHTGDDDAHPTAA